MKRLWSSILLLMALAGCDVTTNDEMSLEGKRYNVLLIMAEDLSPRIGAFGDAVANTPNLDRLASEGVRFTNTFTTAPVCSTSRSSHIMGVHQQTLGTMHHRAGSFPGGGYQVVTPAEVKAYPELLRAAGYFTTNTGKTDYQVGTPFTFWDIGSPKAHWKNAPDDKPFFAMMTIQVTHESSVWPAVRETDNPQLIKQTAKNKRLWDSKTYFTDPADVVVPPYYPDTQVVREALARHYDNIHVMDARVGELLQELEDAGRLDDTIVIWTTDHGDGIPRGKRSLYDSGTRVPMIIRFPDGSGAGSANDEFVSFVDLAPTLLSVAGAERPDWLHGRVIAGEDKQPEPDYIYTAADRFDAEYMSARAVRDKQFKYIRNADETQPYFVPLQYQDYSTIMQELWKGHEEGTLTPVQAANFIPKGKEELYDVVSDPYEVNNLSKDPAYAETLARLRQASDDWTARIGDLGAMDEADFVDQMLPEGKQPKTAEVTYSQEGDSLVLASTTEGASIGYQVIEEGKKNWHWELYTKPLTVSDLAGRRVDAKAIRYGYKVSDVSSWSADQAGRPNIVFILVDDMGYGDLGSYGQEHIKTPNLDRMASEGMRFTDHYAGSTVCGPSRATLMTGLHTGHSPIRGNPLWTNSGQPVDLKPEDMTVAEVLQDAGYYTGIIGKWGLAENEEGFLPAMPTQQGFDDFYGYRRHRDAHYHYWDRMYRNNEVEVIEGNDPMTNTGEYNQDRFVREAVNWLSERADNPDEPFFLYLSFALPHNPVTAPEDSKLPYQELGWPVRMMETDGHYKNDPEGNTAYAGMVSRTDDHVGELMRVLDELGLGDNTLVIFTSDNGHEYDAGFFDSNGPLRGKKRDLYEGGIRIPFIARWPGRISAGGTSGHVSSFQDFLATACDLAGAVSCPESDGLSMVPELTGEGEQQQHDYLYWEFNEKRGPTQAVRAGKWKLVKRWRQSLELYDLESDVGETTDVASQYPQELERLTVMLKGARTHHPEFTLKKLPNPYKRAQADKETK